MTTGDIIKNLRKTKKITQQELATKCNLSKNALWNYENNKRTPNIDVLTKIANALEININLLLDEKKYLNYLVRQSLKNEIDGTVRNSIEDQKKIKKIVSEAFRGFLSCINSEYSDFLSSDTLANIAYSLEFTHFMEFMILKDKFNLINTETMNSTDIKIKEYNLKLAKAVLTILVYSNTELAEKLTNKQAIKIAEDPELKDFFNYLYLKQNFDITE
ncbi:MAG: helix-turn-helix transcriptional regulator [Clostridium perfringens]|nr:helix-turn-helix transcriptional regulator [Clostridium perfringens]